MNPPRFRKSLVVKLVIYLICATTFLLVGGWFFLGHQYWLATQEPTISINPLQDPPLRWEIRNVPLGCHLKSRLQIYADAFGSSYKVTMEEGTSAEMAAKIPKPIRRRIVELSLVQSAENAPSLTEKLGPMPKLKRLTLFGCQDLDKIPQHFSKSLRLDHFSVYQSDFDDETFAVWSPFLVDASGIWIRKSQLTDASVPLLSQLKSVKHLHFRDSHFGPRFLDEVLLKRSDWEGISIGYTKVPFKRLLAEAKFTELFSLDLCGLPVSDELLAQLPQFAPNLNYLFLSQTEITDGGLPHLLKLPKLTSLDLQQTNITDVSEPILRKLPLSGENLDGTKTSAEVKLRVLGF